MEGIVTMYHDFMKKAGECLALPSCRAGGTNALLLQAQGNGLSSLKQSGSSFILPLP